MLRSFLGLFFSYYITGVLMGGELDESLDESTLQQFAELYLYGILDEDDPSRQNR